VLVAQKRNRKQADTLVMTRSFASLRHFDPNRGMHDCVEVGQGIRIGKHNVGNGLAVQISLLCEDLWTETIHEITKNGGPWCDDITGNQISVNE
jgi:hypothetical protein